MEYANNDLKIEFRAVPYATNSHVLEYRISPNQDLTKYKIVKILGFNFKLKSKWNTKWRRCYLFSNWSEGGKYSSFIDSEVNNYIPITVKDRKELDVYKNKYDTINKWNNYIKKYEQKEREAYQKDKEEYLKSLEVWK